MSLFCVEKNKVIGVEGDLEEFSSVKEIFSELKKKLEDFKEQVDSSEEVLKSILNELIQIRERE